MAKKDDTMMYVLYAGAAFIAYRWAVSEGYMEDYFNLGAGAEAGAAASQQQVQAQQAQQQQIQSQQAQQQQQNGSAPADQIQQQPADEQPPNTPPGGSGGGGGDVRAQTRAAALNASNQRGGRMNFWEWNWFLPANISQPDWWFTPSDAWGGTPLGRKPVDSEEAATVMLTFDEWWALGSPLMPSQLSGLRRGMGRVNHWSQAPSSGYRVH